MTTSPRGSARRREAMPRKSGRGHSRPSIRPTGRRLNGFAFRRTAARRAPASFHSSRVGEGKRRQKDSQVSGFKGTSLAQPPDISDTFVREVDENLRRDRVRDFFKENGTWLVVGVILFLAACGGIIWYQQHRVERAEGHVEQLAQIYKDISTGNTSAVPKQLDDLSKSSSKSVRASAMFTRAALAIQQNDQKTAISTYKSIADDSSFPDAYRNAALIRQTALEFDQLQPQDIITRLQPLTKAGDPWFGSAGEMTALALVKQGKNAEAGQLFAAIAKDKTVPASIRNRAIQISGTLGVDSSAALPLAQ